MARHSRRTFLAAAAGAARAAVDVAQLEAALVGARRLSPAVTPGRAHFNLAAFAMAQPINSATGNFGDTPLGRLRHPSWSNWNITLARRLPINVGRGGAVRIQIQMYNFFNQVEFTNLDTFFDFSGTNNSVIDSVDTAKYTAPGGGPNAGGTTPPRQVGLTLRFDY